MDRMFRGNGPGADAALCEARLVENGGAHARDRHMTVTRSPRFIGALAALLGLCACAADKAPAGEEDEVVDPGDGGGGGDGGDGSCDDDGDCGRGKICVEQACVAGDRNNSADEAEALRFGDGETFAEGTINPAGDRDWWVIEADGGEYIRVVTVVDGEDEDGPYDTVLRVERANGKPVTSANEFATGSGVSGVDAVAFAYLDAPGLYYVIVEDIGSAVDDEERPPEGSVDYVYSIALQEWGSALGEPDSAEAPSLIATLDTDRIWVSVGALIDAPGDVDHLALEVLLDGYDLFLDGNDDLSGSDLAPRLRLVDDAGQVFLAKDDVGPAGTAYFPGLPAGSYRVELSDAAGAGGPNHWLFLHAIAREAIDAYAFESEPNDSAPSADVVDQTELENSGGNLFTEGAVEGVADAGSDEDWFRFEADYEANWLVACANAGTYGATSTPRIEVYDELGELLAEGPASATGSPGALIENIELVPGTYHLRVVHPAEASGGPGDWYRALVYVASFEVGGYACP
jgi:hypothetical protein